MPKTSIEVRIHENTFNKTNEDFQYFPTKYQHYHNTKVFIQGDKKEVRFKGVFLKV